MQILLNNSLKALNQAAQNYLSALPTLIYFCVKLIRIYIEVFFCII